VTPGQEKHLAEKLSDWQCEGQEVLHPVESQSGPGEEEQPR
jgi:hypothetical protein